MTGHSGRPRDRLFASCAYRGTFGPRIGALLLGRDRVVASRMGVITTRG
jgi:hypothetical protein